MFKKIILSVFLALAVSCAGTTPTQVATPKKDSCRIIGKYKSDKVAVIIGHRCGGLSGTVVTFIIKKKPYLTAIDEGVQQMIRLLGFKPKLAPLINTVVPKKYNQKDYYIVVSYLIVE